MKVCVCTRKVVLLSPTGQTRGVSGCPTDKQRCAHPTEPLEMLGELRQPALEKGRWDSACGYLGDCHLRDRLRGRESGQSHSAKGWLLWKEGALLQLPQPWGREVAGRLAGPFRTEYSYWGDGTLNCSKAPTRCLVCGDPSVRPLLPATVPCREDGHAPSGQASGDSGGSFLQTCVGSPM